MGIASPLASRTTAAVLVACVMIAPRAFAQAALDFAALGGVAEPFAIEASVAGDRCLRMHVRSPRGAAPQPNRLALVLASDVEGVTGEHGLVDLRPPRRAEWRCHARLRDVTGLSFQDVCAWSMTVCDARLAGIDRTRSYMVVTQAGRATWTRFAEPRIDQLSLRHVPALVPGPAPGALSLPGRDGMADDPPWLVRPLTLAAPEETLTGARSSIAAWAGNVNRIWAACGIRFDVTEVIALDATPVGAHPAWPFLLFHPFSAEAFVVLAKLARSVRPGGFTVVTGNPLVIGPLEFARGLAIGHPLLLEGIARELGVELPPASAGHVAFAGPTVFEADADPFGAAVARTAAHEIAHLLIAPGHSSGEDLLSEHHLELGEGGTRLRPAQCEVARATLLATPQMPASAGPTLLTVSTPDISNRPERPNGKEVNR